MNSAESGIDVLSSGNMISDNHVLDNQGYGINLYFAGNNTLEGNVVSGNGFGIYLGDFSLNNTIRNNTVHENSYGIYIDLGSYGNVLYLNDLQDNSDHNAYDFDTDLISTNQWDDGLIGNYFGDNACRDSDGNGICDEEYAIPGGMSADRFPRSSPDIRAPGLSSTGLSTGLMTGSTTEGSKGTGSIGAAGSTLPAETRPTELIDHGMTLEPNIQIVTQAVDPATGSVYYSYNSAGRQIFRIKVLVTGPDKFNVRSVHYQLHPTFSPSEYTSRDLYNDFELELWTWGAFEMPITVTTRDGRIFEYDYYFTFGDLLREAQRRGVPFVRLR